MLAIFDPLSSLFAKPLELFYGWVGSYGIAIMLITILVMLVLTPLNLKQTKSMLEMQLLQPELKKLQQQHRGDRQKLNEEMMKLYQERKVNPMASCLPLLAQMPVFIGMFYLLRGLTENKTPDGFFLPRFVSETSQIFKDLSSHKEMLSFGLDLAKTPRDVMTESFGKGLIYALVVVLLGFLYWVQQRMIASRTVNPGMSATQAKLMQYLPVAFAPFQLFFPTGLVLYYIFQTILRIIQQAYITRRFYGGEHTLGRQAQAASQEARDAAKANGESDGGLFGGLKAKKPEPKPAPKPGAKPGAKPSTGRTTPPKNQRPAASNRPQRPTNAKPGASRHPKPPKKGK